MPLPQENNPSQNSGPESNSLSEEKWVLLAHLVRPQGRNGEILADILTDFPQLFDQRPELVLLTSAKNTASPQKVTLESNWLHKGRIVLKFTGINSISDAELLRGYDVAIPKEQRATLEDGTFYISDLIGCRIIDLSRNADIGEITDVDRESTSTPLLVLGSGPEEILIPFVNAWLRSVDLAGKRIEMSLPEGLLTINTPEAR